MLLLISSMGPVNAAETGSGRCALSLTGRASLIGAALRRENVLIIDPKTGESKVTKLSRRDIWRILRLGLEAYPQFQEGADSSFRFEGSNLADIYLTHRLNQLRAELSSLMDQLRDTSQNPADLVDLLVSHEQSIRQWVLLNPDDPEQGRLMIESILEFLGDLPQRTHSRFHQRSLNEEARTNFLEGLEPLVGYYLFRVDAVRRFDFRIPNSVSPNENFIQWRGRRDEEILAELEWIKLYTRAESYVRYRTDSSYADRRREIADDFIDRMSQYEKFFSLLARYALSYPNLRELVVYLHDLLILAREDMDMSNQRRVEALDSLTRIYANFVDSLKKARSGVGEIPQ